MQNKIDEEYIAGFFDGEGCIGYKFAPKKQHVAIYPYVNITQKYIAGFFDAEGSVVVAINLEFPKGIPRLQNRMSIYQNVYKTNILDIIKTTLKGYGINSNLYIDNKHMGTLSIPVWEDVKSFLELISPHVIVKREQVDIMLNEILPRTSPKRLYGKPKYTHQQVFEIMKWVDILSTYKSNKGMTRKYTEQYFRDLWNE